MILAIDVYYHKDTTARVIGVGFDWDDHIPKQVYKETVHQAAAYVPGQFYKRELPCILKLLDHIQLDQVTCIIVDGHVFIDNNKTFGLGGHLWKSLKEEIPIIGVAKRSFHDTAQVSIPVLRGTSTNPLYVSSIGIAIEEAVKNIQHMHGQYRIPTILKALDQLTRKQ